jgi:chaperonin GroEL (HSP60 family)
MDSPITMKQQKKTTNMAAYMRAYRLANLEKCRQQDREQYHFNKYKRMLTPEELRLHETSVADIIAIGKERHEMERNKKLIRDALKRFPDILQAL